MATFIGLLIGNETWQLHRKSISSLRLVHPEANIITFYSLDNSEEVQQSLTDLNVEGRDLDSPGLLKMFKSSYYTNYNSLEFNIRTSFKWLAILEAMQTKKDNIIFIDSDIISLSPLPTLIFERIWEKYDIFIQDEGNSIYPKHPCTGFMGFKYCEDNIQLLKLLHEKHCSALVSSQSIHDQTLFIQHLNENHSLSSRTYFLPQMLFPVGYMGPIYKNFQNKKIKFGGQPNPYIYHANWAVGIEAKSALMDSFAAIQIDKSKIVTKEMTKITHQVGKFTILLPADHLLPFYQSKHPRYDKFLPTLVSFLDANATVVDVGSNCGDTLAAMISVNSDANYICIEADSGFYGFLIENINSIRKLSPESRINSFCTLIGDGITDVVLKGEGGTKTVTKADGDIKGMTSVTLDSLVTTNFPDLRNITLIKTDTDGWDFNALDSAMKLISEHKPLVFFECQYKSQQQLDGYRQTIKRLKELGYAHWFVFDNFGDFMLYSNSTYQIDELLCYVFRQNVLKSSRTIYYYDILAADEKLFNNAMSAVQAYCKDI